jgi:hypothetical protein
MARGSKLSKKWNTCDSWDLFVPDSKKPYSILNTHASTEPGEHWVSAYQTKKNIYVYDSFARTKKLMSPFVDKMKSLGFQVKFVNKGIDQKNKEVNCGLRCLIWLIFTDIYGITKSRRI